MTGSYSEVLELDADVPAKPTPTPSGPVPASNLKTGDHVFVVFWQPNRMPDGHDLGRGDFITARVIYPGTEKTCIAPDNPTLPNGYGDDEESPVGSPVRFADPNDVYASRDDAVAAAALVKPPARR